MFKFMFVNDVGLSIFKVLPLVRSEIVSQKRTPSRVRFPIPPRTGSSTSRMILTFPSRMFGAFCVVLLGMTPALRRAPLSLMLVLGQ